MKALPRLVSSQGSHPQTWISVRSQPARFEAVRAAMRRRPPVVPGAQRALWHVSLDAQHLAKRDPPSEMMSNLLCLGDGLAALSPRDGGCGPAVPPSSLPRRNQSSQESSSNSSSRSPRGRTSRGSATRPRGPQTRSSGGSGRQRRSTGGSLPRKGYLCKEFPCPERRSKKSSSSQKLYAPRPEGPPPASVSMQLTPCRDSESSEGGAWACGWPGLDGLPGDTPSEDGEGRTLPQLRSSRERSAPLRCRGVRSSPTPRPRPSTCSKDPELCVPALLPPASKVCSSPECASGGDALLCA
mmetsp:Transcript_387/g.1298  ORF Transcript_387/g.1298 Transcript_387/m.1298 type:complete len:298 (+) Transcript_387:37-930(+)